MRPELVVLRPEPVEGRPEMLRPEPVGLRPERVEGRRVPEDAMSPDSKTSTSLRTVMTRASPFLPLGRQRNRDAGKSARLNSVTPETPN